MAGLRPAIHVLAHIDSKDVDARHKAHKAGHDIFSLGVIPAASKASEPGMTPSNINTDNGPA
jgi:hypothetical protein